MGSDQTGFFRIASGQGLGGLSGAVYRQKASGPGSAHWKDHRLCGPILGAQWIDVFVLLLVFLRLGRQDC